MNFGLDLNLHVGLEQKLSPQMIQSLKLLQMNSMELDLMIKQQLEVNPMLEQPDEIDQQSEDDANGDDREEGDEGETREEKEPEASSDEPEAETPLPDREEESREIDWESYLEEGFDLGSKHSEEMESPDERFEKVPVYSKTLQDHLLGQLQDRTVEPHVRVLVEYLIYSLDERGYLSLEPPDSPTEDATEGTAATRAALASLPEEAPEIGEIQAVIERKLELSLASRPVREAFHVLQSLDPAGIGARDLQECLWLQILRRDDINDLARRIVRDDFELLEKLKIAVLAKKYEMDPEQVQSALRVIGTLEPRPGRLVSPTTAATIIPDLIVEEVEGKLTLMLNDRSVPSLRISKAYANLLRKGSKASSDEKKFVREKLNSATWLIRAIEQRKSTMIKVMQAIIESQPEFFTKGPTHLRPLILQGVADKIGMHISTVSRVTNGKYVQTSHGIFELKYFFTAGVAQADGSEISSVTTRDEIRRQIEGEDPRKPLSDQKIVEILKEKGMDVARRTVAKYRDQLGLLPARLRKRY